MSDNRSAEDYISCKGKACMQRTLCIEVKRYHAVFFMSFNDMALNLFDLTVVHCTGSSTMNAFGTLYHCH